VPDTLLLLRAVNVGGKNKLPMAQLQQLLRGLGATQVSTYIQSGNALCDAPIGGPPLGPALEEALRSIGLAVPVVALSPAELRAAIADNPFPDETTALSLAFLREEPGAERVATLEPNRSPGDRFAVIGRVVYLHQPGGVGRSKLTASWLDQRLGTVATARNWATVQALAEAMGI